MLPAEQPDRSLDSSAPAAGRPRLAVVALAEEQRSPELPYENGLLRSALIGAVVGFTIVFAMTFGGLLVTGLELSYVLPSALFVSVFGGVGFGGMQAAALHRPRTD